ncbi:MAG: PQQ-dependent sugar dehydrogenase [Bacteroidetes bacterium]|nr:PQQ-dependent sugar dehydrogenase [Bacteroidota bacterium]
MEIFRFRFFLFSLSLFLFCCSSPVEEKIKLTGDPNNAGLNLPEGFTAMIVADEIGRARHLTVNSNGDIYVMLRSLNSGGGIAGLRDTDGDGRADIIRYFGDLPGTGIEIRNGYLYFASDTSIYRYKLNGKDLIPQEDPEPIVSGFIFQRQHAVKPFTFDDQGNMYVNVGAPSNACQEQDRTKDSPGMDPCPLLERQGGIWRFEADKLGQKQIDNGYQFATGIRNSVAINWNQNSKKLYALQHGRDMLSILHPELYTDEQSAELPSEEFLLVEDGSDFGWPFCYYDHFQSKKLLNPEYGGDGKITGRCDDVDKPIMAFPGHYAPNDLIFYQGDHFPADYKYGAFIAFHGSWNRAPLEQKGYHVVFVPFDGELPADDWTVFADDFAGVKPIMSPSDAYHRPVGLAEGPDGSLYVSDSQGGRIYRIFYNEL